MTGAEPPVFNMLWSYVYARKTPLQEFLPTLGIENIRFFADSGAHSARTLGIHIGVHDYAQWVQQNERSFTIYCNMDVIGAPKKTRENQRIMEDEYGLHPMPVFHTGEDWSVLEKYIEDGYTYIALGKLLGNPKSKLRPWLAKAFHIAGDRAVFHGFGLTTLDMLREFPFYSVDSSTWSTSFRYGELRLFDRGRMVNVKLRNRADVVQHRALLKSYGVPIYALTKGGENRLKLMPVSGESVRRTNDWYRRLHGPIELPEGKGYPPVDKRTTAPVIRHDPDVAEHKTPPPGLHLYIATASANDTTNVAPAFHPTSTRGRRP